MERTKERFRHIDCADAEVKPSFVKSPWQQPARVELDAIEERSGQPRDPEFLAYTDGSCRNGLTGAGVYFPALNGMAMGETIATAPETDSLHAELQAILKVL